MKIITGQILKHLIVIICCCLCITITNCDKKLVEKRNVFSSSLESHEEHVKSLQSPEIFVTPAALTSDSKSLNQQNNHTDGKIVSENNLNDKKLDTKNLTSKITDSNNLTKVDPGKNINSTSTTTKKPRISPTFQPPINTGALLRGTSVFLGLSIVVIAYIIFRCTRLNKNRTQMVRKYGILAHRQDVEMRPLPLNDEDEDDTTVFDASEVAAIHDKHRRMT